MQNHKSPKSKEENKRKRKPTGSGKHSAVCSLAAFPIMYLPENPHPIDYYKEVDGGGEAAPIDLVMDLPSNRLPHPQQQQQQQQQQMILGESSGEDHELKAPKKRAETWVQEETRSLISFRRELDALFNTTKSNKHLWEQISNKMRDKGFDRSPTMCTDKWRNLLKEYKKAKHQDRGTIGGNGSSGTAIKMLYYNELEELLRERAKSSSYKSPPLHPTPKVDAFIHFSEKGGIEDANISFASVEANGCATVNLDTSLDNDSDPLAITAADAVTATGAPAWNWRETSGDGGDGPPPSCFGRVITVKWGDYCRRIGIDGTADAIKETIKSAFRLRTKRAFWLEDEDGVIRSLDRNMPLGNYSLHLDEGITVKVCLYDESDRMAIRAEDVTLYTEDDFHNFLTRRGYLGLREINGYNRCSSNLDGLRPGEMYQGVRNLGE